MCVYHYPCVRTLCVHLCVARVRARAHTYVPPLASVHALGIWTGHSAWISHWLWSCMPFLRLFQILRRCSAVFRKFLDHDWPAGWYGPSDALPAQAAQPPNWEHLHLPCLRISPASECTGTVDLPSQTPNGTQSAGLIGSGQQRLLKGSKLQKILRRPAGSELGYARYGASAKRPPVAGMPLWLQA